MRSIRIGNGCGFWGDNLDAPIFLAQAGRLHYLTLEYLAELTMSILALQKQKDPQAGFATDFVDVLRRLCPILKAQPQLKIITNAGGMNPSACAARARNVLAEQGLADRRIATVAGDDLMPQLDELAALGQALTNLDTSEPLANIRARIVSANAYLGAGGIVSALQGDASVVITGRVADASLTLAPAIFEFDWSWTNWDLLSAASIAGHIIECGAQASGGLWCNWRPSSNLADVGYPIAEIETDGTFRITKAAGTGGAVNIETVSEQILYEVSDLSSYLTPDVSVDFTSIKLEETGRDIVTITGAKGKPASDSYKVSAAYRDGFMSSGTLFVTGPDAVAKARHCGEIIFERLGRAGFVPEHKNIECLGTGDSAPGVYPSGAVPYEIVLRVAVHDSRRDIVERFTKELAPLVTAGPPGVTGYAAGRPPVREVFAYWPGLIPKRYVKPEVTVCE